MIKANILIVDNTPLHLISLSRLLTEESYEVGTALNGEIALSTVKINPPDLILLEINLPERNGYQVCQHLKADIRTREIPVIFISALKTAAHKVKAFDVGGVDYITKPCRGEEVCVRIQNQLRIHRRKQLLIAQNTLLKEQNDILRDEIRRLECWQIRRFCTPVDLN